MTEDVILCQEKAYTSPENDFTPLAMADLFPLLTTHLPLKCKALEAQKRRSKVNFTKGKYTKREKAHGFEGPSP
jgi:hypothetical protein